MTRYLLCGLLLFLHAWSAAQDEAEPADDGAETFRRVAPVFEPGSHTRMISALTLTPDKAKLITVGDDSTIQIWSAATGERLDILRLPTYGQEESAKSSTWDHSAISADGNLVAFGGGHRKFPQEARVNLVLVNIARKTIRRVRGIQRGINSLAFAPDGKRLAVASGLKNGEILLYSFDPDGDEAVVGRRAVSLEDVKFTERVEQMSFSPDGGRLLVSCSGKDTQLWDVAGEKAKLLKQWESEGHTTAFAWSADGKRFARCWTAFTGNPRGFEIRQGDGEPVKRYAFGDHPPFAALAHPVGIRFLTSDRMLVSTYSKHGEDGSGAEVIQFDLTAEQGKLIFAASCELLYPPLMTVSADGRGAAITTDMGLNAVLFRPSDGKVISHCGAATPIPTRVGWSAAGKPPGFAWTDVSKKQKANTLPEDLEFGFDLAKMEPVADFQATNYGTGRLTVGDYSATFQAGDFLLKKGGEDVHTFAGAASVTGFTLVPQVDKPPLVAVARRRLVEQNGSLTLHQPTGAVVRQLKPNFVTFRDVSPSPDGRFLITSTGTHRLCVYSTAGGQYPLLSVALLNGEWLAWSGEGYFTASPGGEKLIGWAVNNGSDKFVTFHSADKFAKHFRRPDVLAKAIELGSIEKAVAALGTVTTNVERHIPPGAELKLVKQTGATVQVKATAAPGADKRPVIALRLLLNGRPLAAGNGVKDVAPGEPATATWNVEIPAGGHELKLLARSEDGASVSPPLAVTGPKSADQQPTLYRLCVGVNQYEVEALRLSAAAGDATRVFAGLEKYCVGPTNRFGAAPGKLLVDREVTRAAVLEHLSKIRQAAKPGDLVVIHFAGHGMKQRVERKGKPVEDYFLLTSEADPAKSLEGKSLSGEDLRTALSPMECPVLLALDACHSARGVKAVRPATDDLARNLTDDSAGVTVLAAAMAHEVASESAENGYFSAALLKALQAGEGVPFDPEEHAIYTHHIYSVVFSEVRKKTNGKQNPFLNMPWTVPPQIVRETPKTSAP